MTSTDYDQSKLNALQKFFFPFWPIGSLLFDRSFGKLLNCSRKKPTRALVQAFV